MKKILLATAAVLAATFSGAQAADLGRPVMKAPPPPPAPIYSWTGCYLGAGFGYGMWNQQVQEFAPGGVAVSIGQTNGGRGWLGTVQVGCDVQVSPAIVIGAFADYDWSNIRGDMADGGIVANEKLSSSWAAGGRIGWVVVPQLLAYVSAGYSAARFDQLVFLNLVGGAVNGQTIAAHTYDGWFIGSGYEYAIGFLPGLFWKTEYRFMDYGTDRLAFLNANGVPNGFTLDSHKYVQTLKSELVWRFNWASPVVAKY
ncbi:MAG: porin family protein [Hyphomicrobiales bacterium]|nr:porin family protein [Hyphomicrobiales bacterium]